MKIPFVLECMVICAIVAFVSSKSVDRRYGRGQPLIETTTAKLFTNVTTTSQKPAENSVRQEPIVSQEVQVVQDLVDSQEIVPSVEQSDPLQTNDVVKPVETNEIVAKPSTEKPLNENDPNPINKFCSCSSASCKCCRDFSIPLVPLRGPGCATVRYLENDKLSIGIKYGDFVLASRVVDSRRPTPICLPLPGGYNRFCGRVYGITRQEENFKACLGLELRADDDIEASLRVSCFQFGPKGLATMEAEPLPSTIEEDDDDDDDDDDPLGLDELAGGDSDDDDSDDEDEDSDEAPGPGGIVGDVLGGLLGGGGGGADDDDDFGFTRFFSSAGDFVTDFFGGDSSAKNKKKPNEGISIDEKSKKKIDIAKKTPKTSANKKDEADDESLLETIEDELAEELNDEEEQSTNQAEDGELKEVEKEKENTEKDEDEDDYKEDEDDDDDEDYTEDKEEDTEKKEPKPSKKKKVTSSYGFGFLGRFFNFFS